MDLHPQGIKGPWQSGIVLDWHTVSSECIGENEFGSMRVDSGQIKGRSVLLVDDLYRSGATMIAATNIVLEQGDAKSIYVFAITRTRVHR